MQNFDAARTNMVDSQIHTAGVISAPLLNAFRTVPRELFVPEEMRGLVYADKDLPLGQGHFLMEPAVLARMIETADIQGHDTVLNVGDSTGYTGAILAGLVSNVTSADKMTKHGMFSLIFLNGAVEMMPADLLQNLALRGRMIGVVRPASGKIGTVTMTERISEKNYSTKQYFDAATAYIPGFEPLSRFTFNV